MTPEGRVKALIKREFAKAFPGAYRFMPVQNGMGAPALDFFYCINGWFVVIEAKALGKQPTDRQEETMRQIAEAGGIWFVIDSAETCADVIMTIQRLLIGAEHAEQP